MQVYKYDEKTKEYIGTEQALIDPLESELQGKEIYLLPANATFEKPNLQEGFSSVFNGGKWENIEDNRGKEYWLDTDSFGTPAKTMKELGAFPTGAVFTAPAKTIEQLKQDKILELKTIRDTEEVKSIAYNGNLFDYDDKARERMRIAQQALSDNNIPNQLWTTYDNTQVELTVQDFKNINTLAAKRSGELHIHYNTLKQEVLACTTNEDVEKIEW